MRNHRLGRPRLPRMRATTGGAHVTQPRPGGDRVPRPAMVLGAGLAVLVGAGIAIALTVPGGTGHETTPRRATASHPATTASAATTPAADVSVLQQCQQTWQAVHGVLVAAEPAMQQWRRHISVMNQFVAGKLTPAQANEFWDQTRERAERLYGTFTTRDQSLLGSADSLDCPDPPSADTSADTSASPSASPAVADCERAVAAQIRTLNAARATLTTWHHHIGAMNQLRAGMLDPGMAQQMWIAAWHAGDAQLQRYQARQSRSAALSCTT